MPLFAVCSVYWPRQHEKPVSEPETRLPLVEDDAGWPGYGETRVVEEYTKTKSRIYIYKRINICFVNMVRNYVKCNGLINFILIVFILL